VGVDPRVPERHDGDREHLDPAVGRREVRQQPRQLPVVGERDNGLVDDPELVDGPGQAAEAEVRGPARKQVLVR
jgi:hypothetical protein